MVVCFVVEFSVSIEQTVEEKSEASPAKREEADNFKSGCHFRAHASTNDSATPKPGKEVGLSRRRGHCCSL